MPDQTKPVCPACGSDDIVFTGPVRWSVVDQTWEAVDVYDDLTCNACGKEARHAEWVLAGTEENDDGQDAG